MSKKSYRYPHQVSGGQTAAPPDCDGNRPAAPISHTSTSPHGAEVPTRSRCGRDQAFGAAVHRPRRSISRTIRVVEQMGTASWCGVRRSWGRRRPPRFARQSAAALYEIAMGGALSCARRRSRARPILRVDAVDTLPTRDLKVMHGPSQHQVPRGRTVAVVGEYVWFFFFFPIHAGARQHRLVADPSAGSIVFDGKSAERAGSRKRGKKPAAADPDDLQMPITRVNPRRRLRAR